MLSGFLQAACWPLLSLWWLTSICYTPFLFFLGRARAWKEVIALSMSAGMVASVFGFYWLSSMAISFGGLSPILAPAVVLLYALVGQFQYVLFASGYFFLKRRGVNFKSWLYPIAAAAAFTLFDVLFPKIFCDTQGAILLPWHSLVQIAEHTGVAGLTFLVFLWNVSLLNFFENPKGRREALSIVAIVFLIGGLHLWGNSRVKELDARSTQWRRNLSTKVIQANIGDADKLASEQGASKALQFVLSTYERLTLQAVSETTPDLIVWPETSYPYLYTHFQNAGANQRGEARDTWMKDMFEKLPQVSLYFGGYSNEGGKDFNTAFLLSPPFDMRGRYRKTHLLAFGEYIPLGPFAPILGALIPSIGNFGRGSGSTTMALPLRGMPDRTVQIGPLICYESIIPSYCRDTVRRGAEVLLNITNDSWFGNTAEPHSHLLLTAFRSIELRRPLLRATNTGISTWFDVTGRAHERTNLFEESIYEAKIALPEKFEEEKLLNRGLYLRFGDWFLVACFGFLLGWVLFHTQGKIVGISKHWGDRKKSPSRA